MPETEEEVEKEEETQSQIWEDMKDDALLGNTREDESPSEENDND